MALTLPYPNLDFVPLDILTAEEMNQIVANYTYIASQFPVTSNNIDWTSPIPPTYTATPSVVSTYFPTANINYAQVVRRGGVVQLKFRGRTAVAVPSNTTILTVPPGYGTSGLSPDLMYAVTDAQYATNVLGVFGYYAGRNINTGAIAANKWVHMNFTWVAESAIPTS